MKQRRTTIFSICILTVYVLTVILLAASLTLDYMRGQTLCEDRFNTLTRDTASAAAIAEPGTPLFTEGFKSAIGTVDDIAGVQLSAGGSLLFSYPADISGVPSSSSMFVRSFSTELNTKNTTLQLSAVIYKLSPRTLFTRCAIAFVIILIATFAVILYMIATPAEKPEEASGVPYEPASKRTPPAQPADDEPMTEDAAGGTEADAAAQDISRLTEEARQDEELPRQAEIQQEETTGQESPQPEVPPIPRQETQQESAPQKETGLFSPVTGFGWQSYMKPRLDSELERAAASDMDLSLLSVRIPGLDPQSDTAGEIRKAVLSAAGFKDLVFENGSDGYSVILQEHGIDKALKKAEELYTTMERELAYDALSLKPAIGLSARSLRLISADRLTNESEQALSHALGEDGTRIIAFRVNPDKYRNFLQSGNSL